MFMPIQYYPKDTFVYTREVVDQKLVEQIINISPNSTFVFSGSTDFTTSAVTATASYAFTSSLAFSSSYASNCVGTSELTTGSTYPITSSWSIYSNTASYALATNIISQNILYITSASWASSSTYAISSLGVYDITAYGATETSGTTGAINSILSKIANRGITHATIYIPEGIFLLSNSVTIPPNVSLKFLCGGQLNCISGSNILLEIKGPIEAGPWKIFGDYINPKLYLNRIPYSYFEWWGAVPINYGRENTPDSTVYIQKAIDSFVGSIYPEAWDPVRTTYSGQDIGMIFYPVGIYGVSNTITINEKGLQIIGKNTGIDGTGFRWIVDPTGSNASRSLFSFVGGQHVEIKHCSFTSKCYFTREHALGAYIDFMSTGSIGYGRHFVVEDCIFGDFVGTFNTPSGESNGYYNAQYGIRVGLNGNNGNEDFGRIEGSNFSHLIAGVNHRIGQSVYWSYIKCQFFYNDYGFLSTDPYENSCNFLMRECYFSHMGENTSDGAVIKLSTRVDPWICMERCGGENNNLVDIIAAGDKARNVRIIGGNFNLKEISIGNNFTPNLIRICSTNTTNVYGEDMYPPWTFKIEGAGNWVSHNLTLINSRGMDYCYLDGGNDDATTFVNLSVKNCYQGWYGTNTGQLPLSFDRYIFGSSVSSATAISHLAFKASELTIGERYKGSTAQFFNKTYFVANLPVVSMYLKNILPMNSLIFAVTARPYKTQFLNNSIRTDHAADVGIVGNQSKWGSVIGINGTYGDINNIPFNNTPYYVAADADSTVRSVILTGNFNHNYLFTQTNYSITCSNPGAYVFDPSMVGKTIVWDDGTSGTIASYIDNSHVTVDFSKSISSPIGLKVWYEFTDNEGNGQYGAGFAVTINGIILDNFIYTSIWNGWKDTYAASNSI